jgi:hypothetical protein
MLENGDYKLIAVISTEGTGKSTFIKEKIIDSKAYDWSKQRCLIITESEPKAYAHIRRVDSYEKMEALKKGIIKFWDWNATDEFEMMDKIRKIYQKGKLQNGLLVLEDSTIYLPPNTPTQIKSLIISRRMFHIDVVISSHSFNDYPAFLRRRTQLYVLGKMKEYITEKKLQQLGYSNTELLFKAYLQAQASPERDVKILVKDDL